CRPPPARRPTPRSGTRSRPRRPPRARRGAAPGRARARPAAGQTPQPAGSRGAASVLPVRVAAQAGRALVDVPAHVLVLVVHLRLAVLVADEAAEDAEVAGLRVARLAARPRALVLPAVDGEERVVVEVGAFPGVHGVALEAVRREAGV